MVGWLSGFRAQTGSVAYWCCATFVRRLGEAAASGGGECGPCPDLASNTLAFALQLRENHGKTSVRVSPGRAKPSQAKPSQAKPSQAKVLTGGGDLREAQVDVPRST